MAKAPEKLTFIHTEADILVERLKGLGFKLGGPVTLYDLKNYVEGRSNPLYEFHDEVMTKDTWMERYAARMVALGVSTPGFAKASAEASFDPAIWGTDTPESAADEEMSCWGE